MKNVKMYLLTTSIALMANQVQAAYLPPPESPYWCYEDCIDPYYQNHEQCVEKCYDSQIAPAGEIECSEEKSNKNIYQPMGAACCSWGENIQGCMKGC